MSKETDMSKKTVKQDGQGISIEETGTEFRVVVRGEAYAELMKTPVEFPAMAGNPKGLAVFALMALASMLSKQLIEDLEKSGLDGAAPPP